MMHVIKTAVLACMLLACTGNAFGQAKPTAATLRVHQQRLKERIATLATFGKDSLGRGYRVAYSKGDVAARAWLIDLMKKAGLHVSVDYAGNIIGTRQGSDASLKPITFGSHINMVPDGGNYDGCVGSISALEMIEVLNENYITTRHPLEVLIFSNEEGGTYGSMAMAGHLTAEDLKQASQSGLTIADGIRVIGGNPDSIQYDARKKGDIHTYLELHIEQGGTLEKEQINIGIVEGIVGIVQWDVTVNGFANHAGTTPMNLRKDAMLVAAQFIIAVNEVINSHPGKQVGTVGKIAAFPGAYNVIPGKVVLGLEIRDLSSEKIWMLFHEIEQRTAAIAAATGTTISFQPPVNQIIPALTDNKVQQKIKTSAQALGLSVKLMPSGAGHDAQDMALLAPVGMIFVPSVSGISHSPKEFTKGTDMANGANVLLQTILSMDKE